MIAHAPPTRASRPEAGRVAGGDGSRRVTLIQGEYRVSADRAMCLLTVLGSCVSACLFDTTAGIGGMNHFLLPQAAAGGPATQENLSYGTYAMELLINGLLSQGASRARLQGKLFGGARMFAGLVDIGSRNAAFARRFLQDEGIALAGSSLGGDLGRRIEFHPATGRARQIFLRSAARVDVSVAERMPAALPERSGELELFG